MAIGLQRCLGYQGERCSVLVADGRRCTTHARRYEANVQHGKRMVRPWVGGQTAARAAVVRAWRQRHGDVCPGWRRPAHAATDLTCDHVVPYATSGTEQGERAVLCRSCNSTKRDHAA